jgi:hypothetical protein
MKGGLTSSGSSSAAPVDLHRPLALRESADAIGHDQREDPERQGVADERQLRLSTKKPPGQRPDHVRDAETAPK